MSGRASGAFSCTIIGLLALLSPTLIGQARAPRFAYIYRDSLKRGVDSAYRSIENDGAQICADLRCPNPYIGIESLSGIHGDRELAITNYERSLALDSTNANAVRRLAKLRTQAP